MLYNTQINIIYSLLQTTLGQATNQGSLLFWDMNQHTYNSNEFCICIHEVVQKIEILKTKIGNRIENKNIKETNNNSSPRQHKCHE